MQTTTRGRGQARRAQTAFAPAPQQGSRQTGTEHWLGKIQPGDPTIHGVRDRWLRSLPSVLAALEEQNAVHELPRRVARVETTRVQRERLGRGADVWNPERRGGGETEEPAAVRRDIAPRDRKVGVADTPAERRAVGLVFRLRKDLSKTPPLSVQRLATIYQFAIVNIRLISVRIF